MDLKFFNVDVTREGPRNDLIRVTAQVANGDRPLELERTDQARIEVKVGNRRRRSNMRVRTGADEFMFMPAAFPDGKVNVAISGAVGGRAVDPFVDEFDV